MEIASYAMAATGLVLVVLGIHTMLRMRLAYRMANAQLVKLAAAGNVDRAEKLCKAGRGTYFDAVAAAIAAARASSSTDVVTLAAASRPAFDAAGTKLAARWRAHANLGFVGAMLLGGGFAVDFNGTHLPLVAGAAIGLLAAVWIAVQRGNLAAALASARSDVLPRIEQALAGPAAKRDEPAKRDESAKRDEPAKRDEATPTGEPRAPAAKDDRASRDSRRDSVVEALAAPVAKRATASLRSGACPLCKHTEIRTMSRTPGFLTYVCGGCGYTQEFAEL
jgi:rubrerythrin